ncbi:olfactory receptor 5V1-like [Pleurodeles waltl]|uniref:olfactory receptor 5V1-like n=1 Tax=Pleurodeles waltl TaxID=8319 RepID=UPI0037099589
MMGKMDTENQTYVKYFILLGLSDSHEVQTALFALFLTLYLVGLLSNITIMAAIVGDPQLHTPMYLMVGNLSLVDMCLMTVTVSQMLVNIISQSRTIPFSHCMVQLYFFIAMVCIDSLLLSTMAYDRYVAICKPLHYFMVMDKKFCSQLVAGSWVASLLNYLLHSMMITRLSFCKFNLIQNFFCDILPLLKLSCSDTSINELLLLTEGLCITVVCILCIVISYGLIISTILRMHSIEGRRKAFSTCSSHLMVVTLYYGTILFTYFRPSSRYSLKKDKVVSVLYTITAPMLNPFIYSLRNDQMK